GARATPRGATGGARAAPRLRPAGQPRLPRPRDGLTAMMFSSLTVAHEDGVGTITLRRPPTNAINGKVLDEIMTALESWQSDPDVAAVILTGGIRNAFCTGGDLQQLFGEGLAGLGDQGRMALVERFPGIHAPIRGSPQP